MKTSNFFALLSRMKLIHRWGLMRNTRQETLSEHSFDVAVLSHALAELANARFGANYDSGRAALLALFHDASEIYTGDLPTPVKYFSSDIRDAYHRVEEISREKLVTGLPDDLRGIYRSLLSPAQADAPLLRLVKAADKLSALIKCMEEEKAGNSEFKKARAAQEESLREMQMPVVNAFMEEFLPGYALTLDEQE